jgi:sterol 3beta-glucosyltransferase
MRITIMGYGTYGDVLPYAALGVALTQRGHTVVLAAPAAYDGLARTAGLTLHPLAGDPRTLLEAPEARAQLAAGDVKALIATTRAALAPSKPELVENARAACRDAEIVVGSSVTAFLAATCAEAAGARLVLSELAPLTPDSVAVTSILSLDDTARLRAAWGLSDRPGNPDALARAGGTPYVHAFSAHLLPRHPSWGESHAVTGAMALPADLTRQQAGAHQDASFVGWVENGPAPVYLGLGSLPVLEMDTLVEMAASACRSVGLRAVVSAGTSGRGSGVEAVADDVRRIGPCDHGWLFPRCAALVHHGGAGTVHAALAAGVPQVICSVFSDQPFWGSLVQHRMLGAHVPFRHLTAATLSDALRRALQPDTLAAARAMQARVASESGAAAAAAHVTAS